MNELPKTETLPISRLQKFLITWLLLLVSLWATISALSYIGELISILLTSALIAFVLNYAVAAMQRLIPRPIAAVLVYLLAAFLVTILALIVVPPLFNQGRQLLIRLPEILAEGQEQFTNFQQWSQQKKLPIDLQILAPQLFNRLQTQAENIASRGFGIVLGTFNWLIDLILILVISFYMLIDAERLWKSLTFPLNPIIREELTSSLRRNLQRFVTGQLLLGLFMAITLSISFRLLTVPFFLFFAVFIGFMEVIPFVGATLGIGAVVIIVAFLDVWLALQVLGIAVAWQQVKDNLVAPRIMGNLTGLSPVIIFVALLLGAKMGGLLGVILAIPMTGVAKSLVEITLDPTLPPQTGSFFYNPLTAKALPLTDNGKGD
ncbi:AI-2E family transporter [Spirulina subsalsa FACHB-351]|uniref:AI-2E family transporter n=1 Tax=Spirulina subsalsa FACHB-351 TaxID=234711 RepID=A0ABT3LBG4_9CYAN|nr:AI-2E family transporter [Spirulina subsalsa]MCW6038439.1 AI-2E family transporter [Spirulina subsalsa FACHB-351]